MTVICHEDSLLSIGQPAVVAESHGPWLGKAVLSYEVSVAAQPRRPIAAVAATTTWDRFPGQWRGMLDQVYACLGRAGVKGGCNVMLYRDLPARMVAWTS